MNAPQPATRTAYLADLLSRLLTGTIKIAGLVIAVYEIFITHHQELGIVALSAFMMAGAQFSERGLALVLDRLFGPRPPDPPAAPAPEAPIPPDALRR